MKKAALFIVALLGALLFVAYMATQLADTQAQPVSASQPVLECPAATDKGAYFSRGIGKDGNVICGFTYFNECPYFAGAEAGTPECEKGKPTAAQLEPWQPELVETVPAAECGGK